MHPHCKNRVSSIPCSLPSCAPHGATRDALVFRVLHAFRVMLRCCSRVLGGTSCHFRALVRRFPCNKTAPRSEIAFLSTFLNASAQGALCSPRPSRSRSSDAILVQNDVSNRQTVPYLSLVVVSHLDTVLFCRHTSLQPSKRYTSRRFAQLWGPPRARA